MMVMMIMIIITIIVIKRERKREGGNKTKEKLVAQNKIAYHPLAHAHPSDHLSQPTPPSLYTWA